MVADDGGGEKLRVGESVDESREGVLRKAGREEIQGGVRGVAGGGLKEWEGIGEGASGNVRGEERIEDRTSL